MKSLLHRPNSRSEMAEESANFKRNQQGFPGGSMVKNPPAKAGDTGSIILDNRKWKRILCLFFLVKPSLMIE